jgi:hypothetical protein
MTLLEALKRMKELGYELETYRSIVEEDEEWIRGHKFTIKSIATVFHIPSVIEVEDDILGMGYIVSMMLSTSHVHYFGDKDGVYVFEGLLEKKKEEQFRLLACCLLWIKVKEKDNE